MYIYIHIYMYTYADNLIHTFSLYISTNTNQPEHQLLAICGACLFRVLLAMLCSVIECVFAQERLRLVRT